MTINKVEKRGENYLVNGDTIVYADGKWGDDKTHLDAVLAWIKKGGVVTDEFTPDELKEQIITTLKNDLAKLYADKKQECLNYIADVSYTSEIDDEYKTKLKLATEALANNDFSMFEIDVKALSALKGSTVTAKQYAQLIVSKGSAMLPTKDTAVLRMGTVRTIIGALITAGAFDKAKTTIEKVKSVSAETIVGASEAQILGLLA